MSEKRIQYIATDLDGTLLTEGSQTPDPELFPLIAALQEKGIHFIAASGRQYANMVRLFGPVSDQISYISENGSLCIHDGTVIARGLIPRDLGLRIILAIRAYPGGSCELSCESRCYVEAKDPDFLAYMNDVIRYDMGIVEDLTKIQEPFLKIAVCNLAGTKEMLPYFQNRFGAEIKVVTAGAYWVDFIAPNANKGTGLQQTLQALGIPPKNGIAFGDEYNDVEMLKTAGISFAMKNSAPGIARHADYTTDSVLDVLKKLLARVP